MLNAEPVIKWDYDATIREFALAAFRALLLPGVVGALFFCLSIHGWGWGMAFVVAAQTDTFTVLKIEGQVWTRTPGLDVVAAEFS